MFLSQAIQLYPCDIGEVIMFGPAHPGRRARKLTNRWLRANKHLVADSANIRTTYTNLTGGPSAVFRNSCKTSIVVSV